MLLISVLHLPGGAQGTVIIEDERTFTFPPSSSHCHFVHATYSNFTFIYHAFVCWYRHDNKTLEYKLNLKIEIEITKFT
jgi:hypothetical protein